MLNVLTIAGSDSCGGAGIQADIKTMCAHGVYGMSVVTAVTAQNTTGVTAIEKITPETIKKQMDAVFTDIRVDAVKIGMLSDTDTISAVSEKLLFYNAVNIVADPVMISKSGASLLQSDAEKSLIEKIIPISHIITPNIPEAEKITGIMITTIQEMKEAAKIIKEMGADNVFIKGGHLKGEATDLFYDGDCFFIYREKRIRTENTHGTGCTISSAIASNRAKGLDPETSVREAKNYITCAITNSFKLGKGHGPVDHFFSFREGEKNEK